MAPIQRDLQQARPTQTACGMQVQVTVVAMPSKVPEPAPGETGPVYYHYHYHRNFERHVTEKQPGNTCAFCLQRCSSFKVPHPPPPLASPHLLMGTKLPRTADSSLAVLLQLDAASTARS